MRYGTDLQPAPIFYVRGEEYSQQLEDFVRRVTEGDVEGVSTFASALATDRVIAAIRGADADPPRAVVVAAPDDGTAPHQPDHHVRDRRRRPRAPCRGPGPRLAGIGGPGRPARRTRPEVSMTTTTTGAGPVALDRLLLGDNQFFGINHMSEEKARAQQMRFQRLDNVMTVIDAARDEGIRTFMCTTHDRIAEICDVVRANPDRYPDMVFLPCMPYAHKYANAITEDGFLGAVRRFLPEGGLMGAALKGTKSLAAKDVEGIATLLIDAELQMFQGLRTPVVWMQNVVVDLLLGLGFNDAFRIFADHVRARHGAEPGFITMNLPQLLDALDTRRGRQPAGVREHQQARVPDVGWRRRLPRGDGPAPLPGRRDVGLRLRRDRRRGGDRVGLRPAEPGVDRVRRVQSEEHRTHQPARRAILG